METIQFGDSTPDLTAKLIQTDHSKSSMDFFFDRLKS